MKSFISVKEEPIADVCTGVMTVNTFFRAHQQKSQPQLGLMHQNSYTNDSNSNHVTLGIQTQTSINSSNQSFTSNGTIYADNCINFSTKQQPKANSPSSSANNNGTTSYALSSNTFNNSTCPPAVDYNNATNSTASSNYLMTNQQNQIECKYFVDGN